MGSSFSLVVPEAQETAETIRAYDEHHLTHVEYNSCDSIDGLSSYRNAIDRFEENGQFLIYEQLLSSIAEEMETLPSDVFHRYSDDPWVLTAKPGLAALVRAFERTRERMAADGSIEPHHERALDSYVSLFDFAIQHGYGVSYP